MAQVPIIRDLEKEMARSKQLADAAVEASLVQERRRESMRAAEHQAAEDPFAPPKLRNIRAGVPVEPRYLSPLVEGEWKEHTEALSALAKALDDPEHGVAVGISDLKYHQLMSVSAGIIAKGSTSFKDIQPHEMAAALSAWALEKRQAQK